jgi:hypothetical protein
LIKIEKNFFPANFFNNFQLDIFSLHIHCDTIHNETFIPSTTIQFPVKKNSFVPGDNNCSQALNNNAIVFLFIFLPFFIIPTLHHTGCIVYVGVKFVNKFATVALLCVIFSIIAVYTGIFVNVHGNDKLRLVDIKIFYHEKRVKGNALHALN